MSATSKVIGKCGTHTCVIRKEHGVRSVWDYGMDGRAWYVCRYENKRNALAVWRGYPAQRGVEGKVIES